MDSAFKIETISKVEEAQKNKEIALLDKIKTIETKSNETNQTNQQLHRNRYIKFYSKNHMF